MTSLRGLNKKGDLEITLLDTRGVRGADIFCIIDLPPNKPFKTHLFKGPDPKFNEKFTLDLMTLNDEEITIQLKEQKAAGSKFLGQIQIQIKALAIQPVPQWYYLTDRPTKEGKTPRVVTGSIQVQLSFVHRYKKRTDAPTAIINSALYEPMNVANNGNNSSAQTTPSQTASDSKRAAASASGAFSRVDSLLSQIENISLSSSNSSNSSTSSSYSSNSSASGSSLKNSGNNFQQPDATRHLSRATSMGAGLGNGMGLGSNKDRIGSGNSSGGGNMHTHKQDSNEHIGEESVIIDETIKDKENIVLQQLMQQKNAIKQYSETLRRREREKGESSVANDKIKIMQMQHDIDEMEKLVSASHSSNISTTPPPSTLKSMTNSILDDIEELTGGASNRRAAQSSVTTSSASAKQPSPITQYKTPTTTQSPTLYNSSAKPSITDSSTEQRIRMLTQELEKERKLKESAIERSRLLEQELTHNTRGSPVNSRDSTLRLQHDDLAHRLRASDDEVQTLTREKQIAMERAKMYETMVDKLEKDIEFERALKKKETERKEFEREEAKRLARELEASHTRVKLVQIELENQKAQVQVSKDKKLSLEKEVLRMEAELQRKHVEPQPKVVQVDRKEVEAMQYKLKVTELDLDSERKSRELSLEKIKYYERELDKSEKNVMRLESDLERLESQMASIAKTNEKLYAERDRLAAERERERAAHKASSDQTSKTSGSNSNQQLEDRMAEMIKLLTARPDGAAIANFIGDQHSPVALRLREINEKIQTESLKNKEMELEMIQLRQDRIQRMMLRHKDLADDEFALAADEDDGAQAHNIASSFQSDQIAMLVTKLEKLDRLEDLMRKLEMMKSMVPTLNANGEMIMSGNGKRSHAEIKAELEQLQKVIMDERQPERQRDDANIKFEKVFQELTQTEEYKRELAQIQEEKRRINEPLNQKALTNLLSTYNPNNIERNPELKDRIKESPELALIGMDPKAIMSKHQNDFQQYFIIKCTLEELRAIRASLPKWRGDQKRQIDWTNALEDKIEQFAKNPPPPRRTPSRPKLGGLPPPPKPPKAPVAGASQASLMNELLRRRRKVD
ncbi:hypothetical protein SAMD00019534_096390 [Acytostelium subglobosum LB1]|uniref:hypothetical protein n=1 Tax=Acytostelium subglobosum LB1 TaxID=1410327 RepID=UPI0006447E63|nr:hypothetical protein SAMD00019534_096390 [Acytostelium subglobosum LB1]GAM26464.1 hypothetical protein SAMD00019534_096390 [Acytostelium subglobosum LB1]|eukprot:XP_012750560.1 hypothetical protein SAMD00019534_096390 [Acytostelium subglobosum LB1]